MKPNKAQEIDMQRPNGVPATGEVSGLLSRRSLLRGTGLTLGLPLLEAMTPFAKSAFAADAIEKPCRMAMIFFPNGAIMPDWKPTSKEEGVVSRDWELSNTLRPLAGVKSKINVIENLAHDNGRANGDGAGDHARCAATFLTAARPLKTSGNIKIGISVDQVAAQQLIGKTRLPSVELGLEGSRNGGSCDSGYSCAYSSNISWRDATRPMPKETTPRMAFERMFGSGDGGERRKRDLVRQSILDVVAGDAKKLMKQVGQTDQRKLDEYFTSVREIEMRIERAEKLDQQALPDIEVPFGRVESFREHARLMYDLMAIGFQTDTMRVATLMLDNAGGNRRYTEVGVKDAHHEMSHHRNREETVAQIRKVDHYLVEQFAYFLEKLDAMKDGEGGSILDQSLVLYGSGISDGNRHQHGDLPIVLAGGGGGRVETGRLIRPEHERPMGNLFLSMLDVMGTPAESIGDSSGRLTELG
ncbi:hypothetical protein Pla22_49430 [Rubripirellula amarantea]|uniref:DUF1552 domain-containing protein n=1 Tax=Rubripirellula amarantea TaxID=2527999 RepID=A0A5C5WIU1_9BACT|nr:DUF1552 domain-containing protein [Rubripirellula amarantea]TWT49742.1 hypothetical protein Pla22_49430 [Rubripirellula amarantea]